MAAAFLLLHQDEESESADDLRRANLADAADADDAADPDLDGGVTRLSRGCRRAGAGAHHRAGNRRAQLKQDAVTDPADGKNVTRRTWNGIWTTVGSEKQLSARRA